MLTACAAYPDKQDREYSPFTAGNVTLTLKKDVTTKSENFKVFGSPNAVTNGRDADEVWSCSCMSFATRVGEAAGTQYIWTGVAPCLPLQLRALISLSNLARMIW
jgi:hypothetical protein